MVKHLKNRIERKLKDHRMRMRKSGGNNAIVFNEAWFNFLVGRRMQKYSIPKFNIGQSVFLPAIMEKLNDGGKDLLEDIEEKKD